MAEPNAWHKPYRYQRPPFGEFGSIARIGQRLVCHECGRDYLNLQTHVWHAHGMLADDYRAAWRVTGPLLADPILRRLAEASSMNGSGQRLVRDSIGSRFRKGSPHQGRLLGTRVAAEKARGKLKPGYTGLYATAHRIVAAWRAGEDIERLLAELELIVQRGNKTSRRG